MHTKRDPGNPSQDTESSGAPESVDAKATQWKLRDIFWLTTALGMLLAYAQMLGPDVVVQAAVYLIAVIVIGSFVGAMTRKMGDALFWSGLISLVAFVAVAGGTLPNDAVALGWGIVGASTGSLAGVKLPANRWLGSVTSGIVAVLGFVLTQIVMGESITWLVQFDVGFAFIVGLLVRPFVDFLSVLEREAKQPRVVLVAWLTLVFLLGNYLVPIVGGVIR
ncbi:MAG: hypothetical protein AAGG44_19105 [Planctomycetota bacterium]